MVGWDPGQYWSYKRTQGNLKLCDSLKSLPLSLSFSKATFKWSSLVSAALRWSNKKAYIPDVEPSRAKDPFPSDHDLGL